ncbi:hypothetical protein [Streptomyces sp. NPDC087787]
MSALTVSHDPEQGWDDPRPTATLYGEPQGARIGYLRQSSTAMS